MKVLVTGSNSMIGRAVIESLKKRNIEAKVDLTVDKELPSYKINKGKIKIENLLFEISGNVIAANNDPILNLSIKGKDMDIKSVLSLIPEKNKESVRIYLAHCEIMGNIK